MTHTIQHRRAMRFRAITALSALVLFAACEGPDRILDPAADEELLPPTTVEEAATADTLTDTELDASIALANVSLASAGSARGIAFGPYNLPSSMLGSTYTGSVKAVGPGDVLGTLAAARRAGARVLIRLSAGDRYWLNKNHTVNLEKWKSQVARFRKVNLQPYIADGTIIGHMMVDEPHDASNWGGKPVPFATLEAMAKYSKQLWPGMTTVVRSYSTWLTKASFRWKYLDATLAQYTAGKGEVKRWLANETSAARAEGLGLMVGINLLNGGNKSSNIKGLYRGMYAVSASQLKSWGSLLVTHPQSCAFFGWGWNTSYFGRSDIKAAVTQVSSKAKGRNRQSCGGPANAGGGSVGSSGGGGDEEPEDNGSASGGSSGGSSAISLRVTGAQRGGVQYMTLDWRGARGSSVDVLRNGARHTTTKNDGHYVNTRERRVRTTYTYKVCQRGSSVCSRSVSVTVR
jgi:hypothetical protein